MNTAKKTIRLIIRCCVCGKEKNGELWYYSSEEIDDAVEYSHGFCPSCYEDELNKIQWRNKFMSSFAK